MTIQEQIQSHMTDAMRSKDALRLSVLRMMKSAVKNKEIEKMKPLEANEVVAVLHSLVKQRRDSVDQFRQGGGLGRLGWRGRPGRFRSRCSGVGRGRGWRCLTHDYFLRK